MIFYYLNLCVIEDVLEKIYIRNMYYVRKKIITLNMYHESEIMKELRDKLKNELEELERKTNNWNLLENIEFYSNNYWKERRKEKWQ